MIEFATQRTIKTKPYSENISYEYQSEEENEFFKRILRLYALLRGSYLSKSHLIDKYLSKVETQLVQNKPDRKILKKMLSQLKNQAIYIDSPNIDPDALVKVLTEMYAFIYNVKDQSLRKQFV